MLARRGNSVDAEGVEVEWWARDKMRRKTMYASRTDKEIEDAVRDALLFDPRVVSFNPDIDSRNGTVILTGTVDNLMARQAAEQDARNTLGVWRVKNHLKVRPGRAISDAELEKSVQSAIGADSYAAKNAWDGGAKDVRNDLTVTYRIHGPLYYF